MINITSTMTQEQILELAHKATAMPSLILLWIIFILSYLLVGLMFKTKNLNWGRFFWMWTITSIITLGGVIFLVYSPNIVQLFVEFWGKIWA